MTTMVQASPRDAAGTLYNIKSEGDEPEVVWTDFGAILTQIGGVETARNVRSTLAAVLNGKPPAPQPLQEATQNAQAAFPGAQVLSAPPADEPWGNPPVPPMQPQYQQPAVPAAVAPQAQSVGGQAPFCQHGQKTFLTKVSQKTGKPWKAWACPAQQGDPTKCELDFIRG